MSDTQANYEQFYTARESELVFPNELVTRIFRGRFPSLDLKSGNFEGRRFCDVGCGDGRNLLAVQDLGLELTGTEITAAIADSAQRKLAGLGVKADIRAGRNDDLPFSNVDYLLSWHAFHYLGYEDSAASPAAYIEAFAAAMRPGGALVLAVPQSSSAIFDGSDAIGGGRFVVRNDPFGVRNGEVMYAFAGPDALERLFCHAFTSFRFGSSLQDVFGLQHDSWLMVAERR